MVFAANTVVDPRAVVVKPVDTDITDSAVLASLRFGQLASDTQVRAANGTSSKCLHVDLLRICVHLRMKVGSLQRNSLGKRLHTVSKGVQERVFNLCASIE